MSTIKVTNIEHGSTTDGGIQLDSSGHVTGTRWIKMRDVSDTVEEWLVR